MGLRLEMTAKSPGPAQETHWVASAECPGSYSPPRRPLWRRRCGTTAHVSPRAPGASPRRRVSPAIPSVAKAFLTYQSICSTLERCKVARVVSIQKKPFRAPCSSSGERASKAPHCRTWRPQRGSDDKACMGRSVTFFEGPANPIHRRTRREGLSARKSRERVRWLGKLRLLA
jgi:hypothetical protein